MIDERHPVDRVGVSAEGLSTASSGNALIRYMRIGLRRYWAILALVAVWQAWVSLQDVNRLVMPSPSDVYADFVSAIAEYVGAVLPTAASAVVGLLLGTMIGAGLALLAPLWKVVTGMATPSLIILRSIPIVMIVPILTKVFSPGRSSVYAITTLIALFPAFVLVTSALSALPMAMDQVAVAFGSSKWRRLRYIHAPAAVPAIFTALKLSAGQAMLAAIVAEFLTGAGGIGKVFVLAQVYLDTSRAWGIAIAGAVASVVLYQVAHRVETTVIRRTT